MRDTLKIKQYLAAQGRHYVRAVSDNQENLERIQHRKSAAKYLATHAQELDDFFGMLNGAVDKALDEDGCLVAPRQNFWFHSYAPKKKLWQDALGKLKQAGLLGLSGNEIVFIDAEDTQFLRGGWLEEYAFHILRDENIFDVALGVEVHDVGRGDPKETLNEFDVLATHMNQLLFVECKTKRFDPKQNDNELSYKLDSLGKKARGLFGETWLLSARAPNSQLESRLKDNAIKIVGPGDLARLREKVQTWIGARHG
jgi:hypothetical protein